MSREHLSSLWMAVESTQSLPALLTNQLQVWRIHLPGIDPSAGLLEQCLSLLSQPEQERAQRRTHPEARLHSVIGRGCLRVLLGAALQVDPREVPLVTGSNGKPLLVDNELAFNVAHSGNCILIALCHGTSVGIDIEQINPEMDYLPVAQDSLTPAEFSHLLAIADPAKRRRTFYRFWVRKEAIAKADGRGLGLRLASFEVASTSSIALHDSIFYLSDLPIDESFAAAVALDAAGYSTILRRFPLAISLG
jgi:4'-phosphopantetheinyl transferase